MGKGKTDEDRRIVVTEENMKIIKDYFTENENKSIREASNDLGSLSSHNLDHSAQKPQGVKWKAYTYMPLKVNRLTESNMSGRVAHWLLSQPDSFEQKVCWSDEKWFVLQPLPIP